MWPTMLQGRHKERTSASSLSWSKNAAATFLDRQTWNRFRSDTACAVDCVMADIFSQHFGLTVACTSGGGGLINAVLIKRRCYAVLFCCLIGQSLFRACHVMWALGGTALARGEKKSHPLRWHFVAVGRDRNFLHFLQVTWVPELMQVENQPCSVESRKDAEHVLKLTI